MAAQRKFEITWLGDTKSFDRSLKNVNDGVGKSSKKFSAFGKAAAIGLGGGIAAAGVALKGFAEKAMEAEKSQAAMETQLKAVGLDYADHATKINEVIASHARLSGFDDEDLQGSFTNIVRVTGNVNDALKLNTLAMDLARAKHIDVAKAGEIVAKVAGGNTSLFKRYGIQLGDNATAQDAIAKAQRKFAGQAKAYGDTSAGAQDKFKVALEGIQETLGAKLLPIITKVAVKMSKFIDEMQTGTGAGGKFARMIGNIVGWMKENKTLLIAGAGAFAAFEVAVAAAGAATKIAAASQVLLNVAMRANPIGLAITAVAALAAGLVIAYKKSDTFRATVDKAFSTVKKIAKDVFEGIKPVVSAAFNHLQNVVDRALPAVTQTFKAFGDIIKGIVATISGILTLDFGKAWDGVGKVFSAGIDFAIGVVRTITSPIREIASKLDDIFSNAWRSIRDFAKNRIDDIVSAITAIPIRLAEFSGNLFEKVKDGMRSAWEFVRDRAGDIAGAITGLPGKIAAYSGNFFEKIKDGINAARDFVRDRVGDILATVTSIPGILTGWMVKAAGFFVGIGRSIARSIRAGLGDLADWIKDAITSPIKKVAGFALGKAQGGFVPYGQISQVGELGRENIMPVPGGVIIEQASQSTGGGGGGGGPMIGTINITKADLDPMVFARELGWRLATG